MLERLEVRRQLADTGTMRTCDKEISRTQKLLDKIEAGRIDPSFIITHRAKLEDAPDLYKTFRNWKDGYIQVVLKP